MTTSRHDERDVSAAVQSWLRDNDEPTPDRNRQIGRIMGRVDETRQRRRLWPLNPFPRRAMRSGTGPDGAITVASGGTAVWSAARAVSLLAVVAIVVVGFLAVALRPTNPELEAGAVASPSPIVEASTLPIDAGDEALIKRMEDLWTAGAVSVPDVLEVYAPNAFHTIMWTDAVHRFQGGEAIAGRMMAAENPGSSGPAAWTRVPDSDAGEHRYLAVSQEGGGIPCVFWIANDHITRHDCFVPMSETGEPFTPGEPPAGVVPDELRALLTLGWSGDRAAIEQAVAPDIIHYVEWNEHATVHKGIEEYLSVINPGLYGPLKVLASPIDLPAPEGELRWTDFSDVGGGTLCTFWARGDKVIRHDCIVPTYVMNNPAPETAGT